MLRKAATSLLTPKHVAALKFEPYPEGHQLNILPRWAGFKIPYFTTAGRLDPEGFFRFRYLQDKPSTGFRSLAEAPEKPRRYAQPADTGCGVYFPPLLDRSWADIARDPEVSVVITEGELKAACGCTLGLATIGLGGVWNWRSAKLGQDLLPVLESFTWKDRRVNICFDSDIATNHLVRLAASRLAFALSNRGAVITWTKLPTSEDGKKQGLDDFAYSHGQDALIKVLNTAKSLERPIAFHSLNERVAVIHKTGEIIELATGNVYTPIAFTKVIYSNDVYSDELDNNRIRPTAPEWMVWPLRNDVDRIEYDPGNQRLITVDNTYNSWATRGWACQPSATGTLAPWEDLICKMLDGVSAAHQLWVRRWFAYPIQHPGTKLATALLIWGRQQGTGKTMLGETMASIYGQNYGTVNDQQLASQFNEWATDKQFIVGDEIALGDKRHTASWLKDMITRPVIRINSKNRKSYVTRDCANYYFTSNREDALYIEADDRRFFVHQVDRDPLLPKDYQAYQRWLRQDGGAARLFQYLLAEVDLGDFDPQGRAPQTVAKADMTASGRGDTEDWCVQLAAEPDQVLPGQPYDLFTTKDLLSFYDPDGRGQTRIIGMGKALGTAGLVKIRGGNNARVEGVRTRLWAVRHRDRYIRIGAAEASRAYTEERLRNPPRGGRAGLDRKFAGKEVVQ